MLSFCRRLLVLLKLDLRFDHNLLARDDAVKGVSGPEDLLQPSLARNT